MQSDGVQMWQHSQPVHLWQNKNAVSMKVQHTQFTQLTQDLEHTCVHQLQMYFRCKRKQLLITTLTWSMCVILLKERSNQVRCAGWARKWLTVFWRSWRSVILLLLRRSEQLRYFISEFFFRGRRPLLGSSIHVSETPNKIKHYFMNIKWILSATKVRACDCVWLGVLLY